jgi:hypothetical protein
MNLLSRVLVAFTLLSGLGNFASLKNESLGEAHARPGNPGQNHHEWVAQETLTPLTDEERQLDLRDILLDQPDFVADLQFSAKEGFAGHGWTQRVAQKGKLFREEGQDWAYLGEIEKRTVRLYPAQKVYDDMLPPRDGWAQGGAIDPKSLAREPDLTFTATGAVDLDGHKCLKIAAQRNGRQEKIDLYLALDLKNLLLAVRTSIGDNGTTQRLRNVSLDVPDALFKVPPDYKPIERDQWTKIDAKVTYGGKAPEKFGVFRSPEGELYIWVDNPSDFWKYLYRPKQKTVEMADDDLLTDRSGTDIFFTHDSIAFSLTDYRKPTEQPIDAHLVVKPNGITFRSNRYEDEKAMVDVSW